MKPCFKDLENYLAEHPYKFEAEDMEGLLDVLFWHYMELNFVSSDSLQSRMAEAREYMVRLSDTEADKVFGCFYQMCAEYQRLAFIAGAQAGSRIALELAIS